MARRHVTKKDARGLAEQRIDRLFELAEDSAKKGNDPRAKRYVSLALRMGERHKVRARHKRRYCPDCHSFYVPPRNVRVRTNSGRVTITCLACGHVTRHPMGSRTEG